MDSTGRVRRANEEPGGSHNEAPADRLCGPTDWGVSAVRDGALDALRETVDFGVAQTPRRGLLASQLLRRHPMLD
jgi:hypothetical protein